MNLKALPYKLPKKTGYDHKYRYGHWNKFYLVQVKREDGQWADDAGCVDHKKECDGRTRLLAEKIPIGMGKGRNQEKNCGDHRHILDLYFVSA